jgi:hypothetical protein
MNNIYMHGNHTNCVLRHLTTLNHHTPKWSTILFFYPSAGAPFSFASFAKAAVSPERRFCPAERQPRKPGSFTCARAPAVAPCGSKRPWLARLEERHQFARAPVCVSFARAPVSFARAPVSFASLPVLLVSRI